MLELTTTYLWEETLHLNWQITQCSRKTDYFCIMSSNLKINLKAKCNIKFAICLISACVPLNSHTMILKYDFFICGLLLCLLGVRKILYQIVLNQTV